MQERFRDLSSKSDCSIWLGLGIWILALLFAVTPTSSDKQKLPSESSDGQHEVEKIAFVRGEWSMIMPAEYNIRIYVMNADGAGERPLTPAGEYRSPKWSPDGRNIAFVSARTGYSDINLMDGDGSNYRRVTSLRGEVLSLTWSPDGQKIAFDFVPTERLKLHVMDIYVLALGGGGMQQIAEGGVQPAWSPNGKRIAFASNRDGNSEIYVMNADGSDAQRLTNHKAEDLFPAWSSEGNKIAFVSNRDGNYQIYVMDADGSTVRQLTRSKKLSCWWPSWAADGRTIAFHATSPRGNRQIYLIDASEPSSMARRLTQRGGSQPAFGKVVAP